MVPMAWTSAHDCKGLMMKISDPVWVSTQQRYKIRHRNFHIIFIIQDLR